MKNLKPLLANRFHVAFIGDMNAGKSSVVNAIANQELSIVSNQAGTTTDPVIKSVEVLGLGAIALIDTAGLDDNSLLGAKRVEKAKSFLGRANLIIIVLDITNYSRDEILQYKNLASDYKSDTILVFNKVDLATNEQLKVAKQYDDALFVSATSKEGIENLVAAIAMKLEDFTETPLVADLLNPGDHVVLVMPIDSEAPKGRIILPQVQVLRECLDYHLKATVVQVEELADTLQNYPDIKLVVTDSQAFKTVSEIVPDSIYLSSFSIVFARQKGDLKYFSESIATLKSLPSNARVAIVESCSHNFTHEDIGRYKIPAFLKQEIGGNVTIDFFMGVDFVENFDKYDVIIHCGSCMMNEKLMKTRIDKAVDAGIPMLNYGVFLAEVNNITDRALKIFTEAGVI